MGTVYSTNCGCLTSAPEPQLCEYQDEDEWRRDWEAWRQHWEDRAGRHEQVCPLRWR